MSAGTNALKLSGNRSHQRTKSPSSGSSAHIGVRPAQLNLALKNVAEELGIDER